MTSWADTEVWKDIPGYEGRYQASNMVRIRSVDRYVTRFVKGRVLSPRVREKGYLVVTISGAGPKDVHRLVALAFHGDAGPGFQVRNLDGNPLNARPENLAWGTQSDNEFDKYRYAGKRGKLSISDVREIRHRVNVLGDRIPDLAREYSVNVETIRQAAKGVTFSWLDLKECFS